MKVRRYGGGQKRGDRRKEYRERGYIERIFGKIKENRRLTVRHEKPDMNFPGFIPVAFIKILYSFTNSAWQPVALVDFCAICNVKYSMPVRGISMNIKEIKSFARRWAGENCEKYYRTAQFIWENPELSMQEFKSATALCKVLADEGFHVEEGAGGMPTAFIARYGSGKPVIGINCKYDALPGLSQSADQAAKSPLIGGAPGHGCGHNLLGTSGVKAAAALRHSMEKFGLSGMIKVIGAPAEELCLGKPFLAKAGAFAGIDAFLDWHP
jgi:hypothetical protein